LPVAAAASNTSRPSLITDAPRVHINDLTLLLLLLTACFCNWPFLLDECDEK